MYHSKICGTAKLPSVALPNLALPNPCHCQAAVRGTAKSIRGTAKLPEALPSLAQLSPWHCQTGLDKFGTAKLPSVALPNFALPNLWHCQIAVRHTAKFGTTKSVAVPNCRPWHCQLRSTAKFGTAKCVALPNCRPWQYQICNCQIRATAIANLRTAKSVALPNLALPHPWHCQTVVRGTDKFGTAKSMALPNPWQCQAAVRGTEKKIKRSPTVKKLPATDSQKRVNDFELTFSVAFTGLTHRTCNVVPLKITTAFGLQL
jgi:hypothetical protein